MYGDSEHFRSAAITTPQFNLLISECFLSVLFLRYDRYRRSQATDGSTRFLLLVPPKYRVARINWNLERTRGLVSVPSNILLESYSPLPCTASLSPLSLPFVSSVSRLSPLSSLLFPLFSFLSLRRLPRAEERASERASEHACAFLRS